MESDRLAGYAPGPVRAPVRLLVACCAALLLAPAGARAHHWDPGACGLPATLPLYAEYAEIAVPRAIRQDVFGAARPPLVLATSGRVAESLRATGAHTIFWQMRLDRLTGLTTAPADPAGVPAAAERMLVRAAAETGCATPLVALNELHGAWLKTPWSERNAGYRANVLTALRELHARGSRPFLLVPTKPTPYLASPEAQEWWRAVAQVSDVVLELHFNAKVLHGYGPRVGSRKRRTVMRRELERFTAIGIPPERLGILHGFQSGHGKGGRSRLPLPDWLRVVKWEVLAARQVLAEYAAAGRQVGSVWSWGWGDFPAISHIDRDKHLTACTYLWARDPALCDAPARAARWKRAFNTSRSEGQIALAPGVHCACAAPAGRFTTAEVEELAAAGAGGPFGPVGRASAAQALFARLVESRRVGVREAEIDRAEVAVVAHAFGGDAAAYVEGLAAATVTRAAARGAIADQIRRRKLVAVLRGRSVRRWSLDEQARALERTTCLSDDVAAPGVVDLAAFVPFLRVPPHVVGTGVPRP
jgi:hypothetical protein